MKKFIRKKPLLPPRIFAIPTVCIVIFLALIRGFGEIDNELLVVFVGIVFALLVACVFLAFVLGYYYVYCDNSISFFCFILKYREIKYSDFSFICISNASYNNGYGYGVYGNVPMKFSIIDETGKKSVVYPFISLHKYNYPIKSMKTKMNSRDLFMLDNKNIYCLGICWWDSLAELLVHTDIPVYILEDVYIRFKEIFDNMIIQRKDYLDRFYIVTDYSVEYNKYLQNHNELFS